MFYAVKGQIYQKASTAMLPVRACAPKQCTAAVQSTIKTQKPFS